MENYELSSENIKEINWVKSQIKDWLSELKEELNINSDSFYEKNDSKTTLKMDIVSKYIEKIMDKEWKDLRENHTSAWIMAVQIALRSTQIWWNSHDKYGPIQIDGILWNSTKEAIKKFQSDNELTVDWLPWKNTLNKIYEILNWNTPGWPAGTITSKTWATDTWIQTWTGSWAPSWETWVEALNQWNDNGATGTNTPTETKEKEYNDGMVSIEKYIPDIKYDLKYATTDNSFWWKVMYKKAASEYLRMTENATKKLSKAQEILKNQWYELKIWDAYRDHDGQLMLRNNYQWPDTPMNPKSSNVAIPRGVRYYNPRNKQWQTWRSWSHHWTWNAIDLTLVNSSTWEELPMPTKFDDFSWDGEWEKVNKKRGTDEFKNAYILRDAMEQAWFYTIRSEWRHYQIDAPKKEAPRAKDPKW